MTDATTTITSTGANQSAVKTQLAQQELSSNFSQFLRLLTTQLQNQDPLNPMDSAQFTQQLVMYSQVEQQLATNTKLDNLTSLSMNSSLALALGYVGKDITYTSAEMNFDGTEPVNISYNLTKAATSATMNVLDEEGNVVYSTPVSNATGLNKITWDGTTTQGTTADAGTYSIQLVATDAQGNTENVSTAVTGLVRGIENQNGVPNLLVGDRAVPLDIIINASTPPAPATTGT